MKKYSGCVLLLLSVFLFINTTNSFAGTRGIKVSVKISEGHVIDLYDDSHALVIGNGNYRKDAWDPLPGAISDVKEVAVALEKNGFNVVLKTDLTKDGFNRVFADFVHKRGKKKNNRLLFYYAGHGYTRKMATGEDLGYLVMIDAPGPEIDPVGFELTSVDMDSLVTQAKKIRSKHVLFMFDSCFSGSILNLRSKIIPQSISDNVRYPVRQFITAGRANEPVPDYSIFKQSFLDVLEGRDVEPIPDGYLTGEELGLYLKNKVPSYNKNQHPQFGRIRDPKLDKGDFVFPLSRPLVLPQNGKVIFDDIITKNEFVEKWQLWQLDRKKEYGQVRQIDKYAHLTPAVKADSWKRFLAAVKQDNPYSRDDDEMRSFSRSRILHWEGDADPVKKQGPVPDDDLTKPDPKITASDGTIIAYASGVVYDKKTGFEWIAGPDNNTTWDEAKSWVESLDTAGSGWRMPTRKELKSLYKKDSGTRNMTPLLKTTGWWAWSGEIKGSSSAWIFLFNSGLEFWDSRDFSISGRVFAVRIRK